MASNKIVSAAVRTALIASAMAAAAFPAYAAEQATELEEIIVTGSLIPQDLNAPGIPVTVMSASDIRDSGVSTNMLDVLQKSQPFFYGSNNLGSDNGNISSGSTNGGSQISLRNRATLVLLNGRRVAVSPVAASGGFNFVDVNMIPVSAIERIEILPDGASATYGADAVGGVVNLILKTNYEGVEVGGRYGTDDRGQYTERSYYATLGAGNEDTHVTFSTEWAKNDPIYQIDRSWSRGQFRSPTFAGSVNYIDADGNAQFFYLNPNLNAPPKNLDLTPAQIVASGIYTGPLEQGEVAQFFDLATYPTMVLGSERRSALLAADHTVNEHLELFGDFLVSQTETQSQLNAQPVSGTVAASNPNNPFNISVTARNRFLEFPRRYQTDTTLWRGVAGIRGDIVGSWKYEVAGNWNRAQSQFRNPGLIDGAAYSRAVANGTYNPFAREQAPGVLESFVGIQFRDYESTLYSFDAKVFGDVFSLPAGAVRLAVGADTRDETLDYKNDKMDQTGGWLQATPTQPFSADLSSTGYFAEVRIPVFSPDFNVPGFYALEFSLAGRQEVYDITDDPFVPKFTMRWQPFGETFAVRGGYSESFTAPTLFELFGPTNSGFTSSQNIRRYNTDGSPQIVNGTQVVATNRQYRSRSGSNEFLDPATSKNWTVGMEWMPEGALQGLEVSLDWFNMEEEDLIDSVDSAIILQSVEELGAASPYASLVRLGTPISTEVYFDDGDPITTPGQITNRASDSVWLSNSLINIAGIDQSGLDFKVGYTYETDTLGTFSGRLTGVWLNEYTYAGAPGLPLEERAGTFGGATPGVYADWRAFLQLGWTMAGWSVGVNGQFIPEIDDYGFGYSEDMLGTVDSYMAWDVRVGYDFADMPGYASGLRLNAGINNVFDEDPPFIEGEGNQSHDISTYDPIGRFYYAELAYKF